MIYRTDLPPVPFSQRDPRWADIPIGTSRTTIAKAGCAVTATASALAALGVDTDPGRLNRYLATHEGFAKGNLLRFNSFGPLGVSCADVIDCAARPAPVDRLQQAIDDGQPVITLVDFDPGGTVNQHWVRLLSIDDDEARIMDPWNPPAYELYWLMARYARPTWLTPARAIFRAVIYCAGEAPGRLTYDTALHATVHTLNPATQHRLHRRSLQLGTEALGGLILRLEGRLANRRAPP